MNICKYMSHYVIKNGIMERDRVAPESIVSDYVSRKTTIGKHYGGVYMTAISDLKGQTFGRLTAVERSGSDKGGNATWLCRCECGQDKVVVGYSLKAGQTSSCGCYNKESASTRALIHGHNTMKGVSPEYTTWANMKARCSNEKTDGYADYGGRGINVCESWLFFEGFLSDMGKKPSPLHSIERNDVNGDYSPHNCRWATMSEQSRNQRAHKKNKTGVRGITWHKNTQKYVVRIGVDYKVISIGYFETIEEAKRMRIEAELKYWGKSS